VPGRDPRPGEPRRGARGSHLSSSSITAFFSKTTGFSEDDKLFAPPSGWLAALCPPLTVRVSTCPLRRGQVFLHCRASELVAERPILDHLIAAATRAHNGSAAVGVFATAGVDHSGHGADRRGNWRSRRSIVRDVKEQRTETTADGGRIASHAYVLSQYTLVSTR
jgi:hypothetical protein